MTLFFAIVAHAILILGIVFVPHESSDSMRSTLDIVLVQKHSETPPDDADYLAQANQEGGGNQTEKARPATPLLAPLSGPEPNVVAAARPAESATPQPLRKPKPEESPPDQEVLRPVIAVVSTETQQVVEPTAIVPKPKRKPRVDANDQNPALSDASVTRNINASELISRSLATASLTAEIDQRTEAYAQRPRRKWISARTREYRYASYMEGWRIKVERIGNLNYPNEARRKRLSGNLRLEVALNSDGSLNDVILRSSSGHRILDDAAIRIVRLSAPFAPFPLGIQEETDILHIERTWRFSNGNQFSSR